MRRKNRLIICVICILVISLAGCSPQSSTSESNTSQDPITLRVAGQFPTDNPASIVVENLKKYVEEKSEGRLLIDHYPANQLGDANLAFEGIMDGSVDMGLLYNSSQYDPMIEINSLPFLVTGIEDLRKVYSEGTNYFDMYSQIFENLNVKVLGIHVDGLIGVHSMEKPQDYADFTKDKQLLIRTPAVDVYRMVASDMGYQTVTIPFADLYTSMQTGVCKGSIGQSVIGAYTGFRDISKFFIPYGAFVESLDYMINQDKWDSLPDDLKAILQEGINIEVENQLLNVEALEVEYTEKLEAEGVQVLPITEEERVKMAEYIREVTWPKLADKFGQDTLDLILMDLN